MDRGKENIKTGDDLPGHYNWALAIVLFLCKSRAYVPRHDNKECLKWNVVITEILESDVYLYVCMVLKILWPKS